MKKTVLFVLLAVGATSLFAQDYDKVKTLYTLQRFEDAKKEVDKLLADPKAKDKAETYLWDLNVNAELFNDPKTTAKYPDAAKDAIAAFDTYKAKDPTLKIFKDNGGIRAVGILYSQSFNNGRDYFSKSKWDSSFVNFKVAESMGEFINDNGFSNNKIAIDTFTVLYTGYAAQNAQKTEEAVKYYTKLIDHKVAGKDFEDIYKFVLDYYSKNNQADNFKKYLAIATAAYPQDSAIWSQFEMQNMTTNASIEDIANKYKEEDATGKLDADKYINYAEALATTDKQQLTKVDSAGQANLKLLAADAYGKAFKLDTTKGLYAFNAGVLTYNIFNVLDERFYDYRGTTADLKAKRAGIEKDQLKYADSSLYWLEKSYTVLKAKATRERNESNSLNRSVDYIANLYAWKRDKARGVAPKDVDKYDAKFKEFDAEHDKYKP
jgi:hypothetical protein